MRRPRGFQQRGERRIAAALRIALAAALLAVQVLFVVLTTRYLKDHFALIYGALEGIALITALYIYNKPGDLSYRVAWIIPILFVPVVGLILYLLWGGSSRRRSRRVCETAAHSTRTVCSARCPAGRVYLSI